MIAMLAGIVDQLGEDSIVLDVNGVGYLVFASTRTLARTPGRGEPLKLLVETHVREDHIHLYGFAEEEERNSFRMLTTVQGVGSRLALSILSVLAPAALAAAIVAEDRAALTQADGVGPKLAQRICSELREKMGRFTFAPLRAASPAAAGATADAVSALINLGYPRSDAVTAIAQAATRLGAAAPAEALVRAGLKELAR
jgi:holliday junction DNA helicase RuvA